MKFETDNYTSITVTDKGHNTTSVTNTIHLQINNSSSDTSSSDTPFIRMMNSDTYDMSAATWAIGTMPTLTFFVEVNQNYQINQNGLRP